MQQGDCNAFRTMVQANHQIFQHMIFQHLIIYIDDIIISSSNHKEHVVALWRVLQYLQDPQFCLIESKSQFITKQLEILGQLLISEGLSADPLKVTKIFDLPEPKDKKHSSVFIRIVNYV